MSNFPTYDLAVILTTNAVRSTIPNVEYQEFKHRLSHLIEKEFEAWKKDYLNAGGLARRVFQDLYYANPYPHTLAGWVKRAENLQQAELRDSFIFIGKALLPLVETLFSMKGKIVKRGSVPSGRPPGYVPPLAETKSIKIVVDVLKKMTDPLMEEYTKVLAHQYIDGIEKLSVRLRTRGEGVERSQILNNSNFSHLYWPVSWRGSMETGDVRASDEFFDIRNDYKEILTKQAKEDALRSQQIFVTKNVAKLAKIVELKNNEVETKITNAYINASGIHGTILFSFSDGSHFSVQNKIVFNHTAYNCGGRSYVQFPTTFHDAAFEKGSYCKNPSHKQMIGYFCGDIK